MYLSLNKQLTAVINSIRWGLFQPIYVRGIVRVRICHNPVTHLISKKLRIVIYKPRSAVSKTRSVELATNR